MTKSRKVGISYLDYTEYVLDIQELLVLFFFILITGNAIPVLADAPDARYDYQESYIVSEKSKSVVVMLGKKYRKAKYIKVTSSSKNFYPSVLKDENGAPEIFVLLPFTGSKVGSSRFTVSLRINGKLKILRFKIKCTGKYTSPVKKIKLGKKVFKNPFKDYIIFYKPLKKTQGKKFSITPNKNWEIVSIQQSTIIRGKYRTIDIKNGQKLVKGESHSILINMKNKRTNLMEQLEFSY